MKNSILLLSSFTAINGLSLISCQTAVEKENNTSRALIENDNSSRVAILVSENDVRLFRYNMNKRIESNSQSLATVRTRIKEEKKGNANFSTTIFELELANGYMKIKLEDYKKPDKDKWEIYKKEFIKGMNDWNIEFTDFVATI